jgi:retron-type reverse transcriptase
VDPDVVKWGGEMSSNYWSSTTNANNTDNAWNVNFNNGNVNNNNKSNSYYVRAVRAGKCPLLSFQSLYEAYLDCRKRKRGTINVIEFEFDLLGRLNQLALALQQGTYRPARSVCFVTTTPKLREIFAADFRDRIVHHLVVRELEKIWEPIFLYDSFASRKEKGIHAAAQRLRRFMVKVTRNGKTTAWMAQLDIRSFFMRIDKDRLFAIFEEKLLPRDDPTAFALLYLLHRIIYHCCADDFVFKGDPAILAKVPSHKTLLGAGQGKGLPIGNLTSQFFANVYLNELDQFIKHELKCRYYVRYVDDFIVLSQSGCELRRWVEQIAEFLERRLMLQIKEGWQIKRVSAGSDFLGYIVRPKYVLVRNRVVNNLKAKLCQYKGQLITQVGNAAGNQVYSYKMAPELVHPLMQTMASYLGHFKHADSYTLIQSLFSRHQWLTEYFYLKAGRLKRKYRRKGFFRSFPAQVRFFRAALPGPLLLFEVGHYIELFNDDANQAGQLLGLRVAPHKRGMARAVGFPAKSLQRVTRKLLDMGKELAIIKEQGAGPFVKDRQIFVLCRIGVTKEKECTHEAQHYRSGNRYGSTVLGRGPGRAGGQRQWHHQ